MDDTCCIPSIHFPDPLLKVWLEIFEMCVLAVHSVLANLQPDVVSY